MTETTHPIPPILLVCERFSTPPDLALILSLHRHPYLYIPPIFRFIRYNNNKSNRVGGDQSESPRDVQTVMNLFQDSCVVTRESPLSDYLLNLCSQSQDKWTRVTDHLCLDNMTLLP